ncbi:hypothetical protein [Sphingomonas oryzagri]
MNSSTKRRIATLEAALKIEDDPNKIRQIKHEITLAEAQLRILDKIKAKQNIDRGGGASD